MSVTVSNLVKVYGTQQAVDDISFTASKGSVIGFLGPNGAGKSTTMKMITCYLSATSGSIDVCGFNVEQNPMEVKKRIGYLPEHNPLYLDMYVKEYLEFVAGVHQLGKGIKAAVEQMVEVTGLTNEYKKQISALSKGYRQRVGLAQAMIHNPEVLILDEPTSGLDPNQIVEIRNLIKEAGKDKTVILSTHIMQEVQAMCDRVLIINKGKLVADSTSEELQKNATQEFTFTAEFKHPINVNLLRSIQGVRQVKADGNTKVVVTADRDIREQLFAFAVEHQLVLLSVNMQDTSLEDVFRKLTGAQ
ncbi:MAG: gliding motility-associated ABC transporter ATP-binding subunit GldA [Bacteroidia bacterium]